MAMLNRLLLAGSRQDQGDIMNKDEIIRDIDARLKRNETAWIDVAWLVNEVQWMRDMLRREWPDRKRPGWVELVLDDQEVAS